MPIALTAAAVAGPIVGGIIGNMAASDDREAAMNAAKEAMAIIDQVGAPPDLSKEIILEKLRQVGVLTPQLESQINLGMSKVAQIQENPELKNAQMTALSSLKDIGHSGMRPEDRAALADIQDQTQGAVEAKRQQILQNLQARGQAGSGAEIAASLAGAQGGAQEAARASREVAGQASQRALQAIMQGGNLAGNIRGQDFDVNKTKANAEDVVNQFNANNAVSRQSRNVNNQNIASQYNLGTAQNISNANTNNANNEKYRQAEAQRQYWQDKLQLATAKSNARSGVQSAYNNQADRTSAMWQNIGNGVGQGAAAVGGYMSNSSAKAPAQQTQLPTQSNYDQSAAYQKYLSGS